VSFSGCGVPGTGLGTVHVRNSGCLARSSVIVGEGSVRPDRKNIDKVVPCFLEIFFRRDTGMGLLKSKSIAVA